MYTGNHAKLFFNRTYRLFSEHSALLQNFEEYCYYEIQIHKALCEVAVKKGYCWLKEGLPPPTHKRKYVIVLER
jgi:hypothetical protein